MRQIVFDLNKRDERPTNLEILDHPLVEKIIDSYFRESDRSDRPNSSYYQTYGPKSVLLFLRHILEHDEKTMKAIENLSPQQKDDLLNLIDSFYDYFRGKERYVFYDNAKGEKITHREFIHRFEELSENLISFYRDIYETISGHEQTVYRILPAGGNAGILLHRKELALPKSLSFLKNVPLMESVITHPPFIIKTRENKRKGLFEYEKRKVREENFNAKRAYGVILRIYDKRALIFFDKDYLGFLVALGNLFQIEPYYVETRKDFDLIVLFGTEDTGESCYYYKDGNTYVGVCPKKAKIDYFGYAKKMILTLYNLTAIDRKLLPIHGAGVRIRKGEKSKNIFFLGDSGAGKSETLEAVRNLAHGAYQIETIFDDMGTFHLVNGKVYATGTEIGAFVRLDDLDQGYSLRSADRAVYFNIDEDNSRVVIPIEDFEMTYTLHEVDCFLLADNFTETMQGIALMTDPDEARMAFEKGERVALNTTNEKGLVTTFFANPFGPVQRKKEVEAYLPDYFDALFSTGVPVGRLYTRLSLDRKDGPKSGAKALLRLFDEL